MNSTVIELPERGVLRLDRLRALYNGFGYALALALLQDFWWTSQETLPSLFSGGVRTFAHAFLVSAAWTAAAMIPGPTLIPVAVNLAPRAGLRRFAYLFAVTLPMWVWCVCVVEGVRLRWDWQSLGYVIDGVVTTSLVVGVCAYHSDSRHAEDAWLGVRIRRASLDSDVMRMQLDLLRAQIEPHFLFNTLSVVRALSRNDPAATVAMLDNLIRYFEAALPRLRAVEVPLAEELELVDAYLAIYRARMGSRLRYEIVSSPDLAQSKIPSMILLTLVENALKHGVGPVVEGGLVRVTASRVDGRRLLQVADSGQGLAVRQGLGTGLANARQRLLIMYGADAKLTLRSAEPRGVVASLSIPDE